MCGRLRRENLVAKIGTPLPIKDGEHEIAGFWAGHAREESLDNWKAGGWKEAILPDIKTFTEGYGQKQKTYKVPALKNIKIIYHPEKKLKGNHPFNIVTREAQGEEQKVHPRFPRLVKK